MPHGGNRFEAKTALVTGAARGIGAACARRLGEEGAEVLLTDVDEEAGRNTAAELAADGIDARFRILDAGLSQDWSDAVAELGRLDVLVSNVARAHSAPLAAQTDEQWEEQIRIGLSGAFYGVRAAIGSLRETRGAVVVTSSVHALFGLPGFPAYAAAKGGLTALIRQLAVEYGPAVRFNAVLPGPIDTPNWDGASERDRERSARATALARLGRPEEVASAVAFLASEDASYITGGSLIVDGGWSIAKDSA